VDALLDGRNVSFLAGCGRGFEGKPNAPRGSRDAVGDGFRGISSSEVRRSVSRCGDEDAPSSGLGWLRRAGTKGPVGERDVDGVSSVGRAADER
jgi:hypothetical protein